MISDRNNDCETLHILAARAGHDEALALGGVKIGYIAGFVTKDEYAHRPFEHTKRGNR